MSDTSPELPDKNCDTLPNGDCISELTCMHTPKNSEPEEYHRCHFCGEELNSKGYEYNGTLHLLSYCRSDLVEHEIGETCTWSFRLKPIIMRDETVQLALPPEDTCYAYQEPDNREWTTEHKYFYKDGPM